MSNSPTPVKYTPVFHMPIIDSSQDYVAITASNLVTASQVNHYALRVSVTNITHNRLFSMAGGVVYFVPEDTAFDAFQIYQQYPNLPSLSPGTGFLLQGLWPADYRELNTVLPVGVPSPAIIIYLNVDPGTVRSALKPFVQAMPDRSLVNNPLIGDHQQHVEQYLDKVLLGDAGVFVKGGSHIGNMATTEFTLFVAGLNDLVGLSPILHLRRMPSYGGEQWLGHPLIDAVATLPVPVDIYLEFKLWNNQAKAFMPLASGVTVDLMDRDLVHDDPLLTTTTDVSGNGRAHFTSPNLQIIDEPEPDLYFQVPLGNENPDPSVIAEPWSSEEWVFLSGFWPYNTGDGYYDNFDGTRLGNPSLPLLFRIGLGFWADLISLRAPISVQQQLKNSSPFRFIQFIEDAGEKKTPTVDACNPPVNLDYYPVRVTILPTINNHILTPMDLLNHMRLNINTLVDTSLFEFALEDPSADRVKWESVDPADLPALQQLLGIVLKIDFYGLWTNVDDGSVLVADIDTTQFTFSTIKTLQDLYHPVSGNRQIGFKLQSDGSWIFYTRGADRPATRFDDAQSAVEFRGADVSWKSLQHGVARFVNDHGGAASVEPAFSARFPWDAVKALYWHPTVARL